MTATAGTAGRVEVAWRLAVYLLVMAVGMMPLFAGSALSPELVHTGIVSRGELGIAWGFFFGVAAVCSPLVGRLIDVGGAQRVAAAVFACTGVALLLLSAAGDPPAVFLAYALGGLSVAGAFGSTSAALGSSAAVERGSLHIGIAHAGTQVGALAAGSLLPLVAIARSWQAGMATAAGAAVVGIVLLGLGTWYGFDGGRAPADRPRDSRAADLDLPGALYVYAIVTSGAATVSVGYLPLYANEEIGLPAAVAGATLSVAAVLAIIGKVLWGLAAGRAATWWAPLLGLGAAAWLAVGFLGAAHALPPILWVGIVLVGLCGQCWAVVTMSGVVKLATPATVGRASGRVLAGGFAGSALLPPLFGVVVDVTGRYWAAWSILALVYLLAMAAVAGSAQRRDRAAAEAARLGR